MPLHIKDRETTELVRQLASRRHVTLTAAVRLACREALDRDRQSLPIAERLADIHARVRAAPATGEHADKAFFDREWGESE